MSRYYQTSKTSRGARRPSANRTVHMFLALGRERPASSLSQRIHEGFDSAETSCAAVICSALFRRLVGGERQRGKTLAAGHLCPVTGAAFGLPELSGDLDRVDPSRFS